MNTPSAEQGVFCVSELCTLKGFDAMNDEERKALGGILVFLDETINTLDRLVFEAAYYKSVGDLDAQLRAAQDPGFYPPIKQERDSRMHQRNVLARILGFCSRRAHDLSPRDYIVIHDGWLVPRGQ